MTPPLSANMAHQIGEREGWDVGKPMLGSVTVWEGDRCIAEVEIHNHDELTALERARLFAGSRELLEGAQDAVEAFKLLRIGMASDAKAVEMIDAHIDELAFAIARALPAA